MSSASLTARGFGYLRSRFLDWVAEIGRIAMLMGDTVRSLIPGLRAYHNVVDQMHAIHRTMHTTHRLRFVLMRSILQRCIQCKAIANQPFRATQQHYFSCNVCRHTQTCRRMKIRHGDVTKTYLLRLCLTDNGFRHSMFAIAFYRCGTT